MRLLTQANSRQEEDSTDKRGPCDRFCSNELMKTSRRSPEPDRNAGPNQHNRGQGVDTYMHPIDGVLEVIVQASQLGCICILVEGVLEELQV